MKQNMSACPLHSRVTWRAIPTCRCHSVPLDHLTTSTLVGPLVCVPKEVYKIKSVIHEVELTLSLTEDEKEGQSKLVASHEYLEPRIFGKCKGGGIGMSRCVEYLGIKEIGAEDWYQFKQTKEVSKAYMRTGTNKVLRRGVMPGRAWGVCQVPWAWHTNTKRSVAKEIGQCLGTTAPPDVLVWGAEDIAVVNVFEQPFTMIQGPKTQ